MPLPDIEHFVILMMENRSFDHIFGFRSGVNGLKGTESNLLDPTKSESATNPAFGVNNAAPFAIDLGQGPGHSVVQTTEQLFGTKTPAKNQKGLADGFVMAYSAELFADHVKSPSHDELDVVMESFAESRLPSLTALADNFCLCDNWFSEVPGPTQPNRLYLHAATSAGWAHNSWKQPFDLVTIYENIQNKGLTWSTYEFDQNEVHEFTRIAKQTNCFKKYDAFQGDVKGSTLPNYCFIAPRFFNTSGGDFANDEHAPGDIRYGDNLIADVYETLRSNSAVWNKSVLIVTYDEHGGFYDHVVPPAAVNPDGINSPAPGDKASYAPPFAFDRLGLRVPTVIVSPLVGKGVVLSAQLQHTSILSTAKEIFGLPKFLTKRDTNAATFTSAFTQAAPRADAPQKLPRATLPKVTAPADSIRHPSNHPLDHNQQEMLIGVHQMTKASSADGLQSDELPRTQGEASDFIRRRYDKHFGMLAGAGAHLKPLAAKDQPKANGKNGGGKGKKGSKPRRS